MSMPFRCQLEFHLLNFLGSGVAPPCETPNIYSRRHAARFDKLNRFIVQMSRLAKINTGAVLHDCSPV